MRRFETRQDLGDGWTTEWEPADHREHPPLEDGEARRLVRTFNAEQKRAGSNVRMRSVDVEDVFA